MARRTSTSVVRTLDLGVDIGSANTVVASASRGVVFDEPTCVAFGAQKQPVAFGYEAAATIGRSEDRLVAVRPLSRTRPLDLDALHGLLAYVVRALKDAGVPCRSATMPISGAVTPEDESALRRIAAEVGVEDTVFVPDVVAATLVDSSVGDPEKPTAVIDIGAEVTSWGIVEGGKLTASATWELGTKDFCADLQALVQRRYAIALADSQAESLVTSLGCRGLHEPGLSARIGAKSHASGMPTAHLISAADVVDAIFGRIADLSVRLNRVFDGLPESSLRSVVDAGVRLVGGGALVPGLADSLHVRTGLPMTVASRPLHAAAIGASRALVCS